MIQITQLLGLLLVLVTVICSVLHLIELHLKKGGGSKLQELQDLWT